MGFFMSVFNEKIKIVKCSLKLIAFLALAYLVGFFIGLFFKGCYVGSPSDSGVCEYYICIFDVNTSVFSIFFKRFFACLGVYIVIFLLGLNGFSVYFSAIILFYRGLILGSVASVFFCFYGIPGIVVYVFLVIIQNVIISAGMILIAVLNAYYSDKPFNCKIHELITNVLASLGVCFIGFLYELIFLTFILRPITLWF